MQEPCRLPSGCWTEVAAYYLSAIFDKHGQTHEFYRWELIISNHSLNLMLKADEKRRIISLDAVRLKQKILSEKSARNLEKGKCL